MKALAIAVFGAYVLAIGVSAGTASSGRSSAELAATRAIGHYFGGYTAQAVAVARCETGGSFSPWATNGQYHGIFQMGSHERATYGDGWNVWAQARAAYAYFVASGRGWGPWQCKPW